VRNTKPSNAKAPSQSKKKKSSSRRKPSSPSSSADSTVLDLQNDDIVALEAFCENLKFSEITLSEWEHGFESLDITVPIWVAFNDARDGHERIISYSRSVRVDWDEPPVRETMQIRVAIPPGAPHQTKISVPGNGDIRGGKQGDLIVIIHLKT